MEAALLMTRAGAITILTYRFVAAVSGLMLVGPVITRVTTRTVGLKRRVLPGNRLGVGLVTFRALKIAAVIKRLISKHRVAELVGRPGIGVVALITFFL